MKKYYLVFSLFCIFVLLCATSCKHDSRNNHLSTRETQLSGNNIKDSRNINHNQKFKLSEIDMNSLGSSYPYIGTLKKASKWFDANGENILLISEDKKLVSEERGDYTRQSIYAYLYLNDGSDTPKLLWKIQDVAENICDPGLGLVSDICVNDYNEDNIGDNIFIYNLSGSCQLSPLNYKLVMHSGKNQFSMEGSNAVVDRAGTKSGGSYHFDANFAKAPAEFKKAAEKIWKRSVKDIVLNN